MNQMTPMIAVELGDVTLKIVNNRTMTPEEWADIAINKIIHIAESTAPELKTQAEAFKNRVWVVITETIRKAVNEQKAWDSKHKEE